MSTTQVRTDIGTFAFWALDRDERMAAFRWLRENDAVSWHPPAESLLLPPDENVRGFWALTKHAHILEAARSTRIYTVGVTGMNVSTLPRFTSKGSASLQIRSSTCSAELSDPCRSRGGRMLRWAARCGNSGCSSRRRFSTNSPAAPVTYATSA